MGSKSSRYKEVDLTPYQPFGVPILKLLMGLVVFSLTLVIIYEFCF